MEKMTKREMYKAMINFANGNGFEFESDDGVIAVSSEEIRAFAENEIALLDRKAEKAKEHAAKKKDEADELMDIVLAHLNDEYRSISDIAAEIDSEDASVAKITSRLTKLVKEGIAEKTDLKVKNAENKTRTIKGYRRVTED